MTGSRRTLQVESICQKGRVRSVDVRPVLQRITMNLIRGITFPFQSGFKVSKETFIQKGKFVQKVELYDTKIIFKVAIQQWS